MATETQKAVIAKNQLNRLSNAFAYTQATISYMPKQAQEDPDWVLIHKGRAYQAMEYLTQAKDLIDQLRRN
jgi:hydrogenase maturation factor